MAGTISDHSECLSKMGAQGTDSDDVCVLPALKHHVAAMRHIAWGALRQWSRRRHGRPRLRRQEPYLKLAGERWWDLVGSWRPLTVSGAM